LVTIRTKQLKIFEELTMFEQRILCRQLPHSFNSIATTNPEEQCANKRTKIVQDVKRQMLYMQLEEYELEIQHYEHLYEQELATFKSEIYKTNSFHQMSNLEMIMHFVKTYLYHHTNKMKCKIRYKESRLHTKLLRHQHRHQSTIPNKTIDVYPQIIVDVPNVSLNSNQLNYLSRTGQLYFHLSF
jgi:hypothetical protein